MADSLWNPDYRLALASKSRTRRQMLEDAGIPFDIVEAAVDERAVEAQHLAAGGALADVARAVAEAKALAASRFEPAAYCLGADQILLLGDEILHKSPDLDDLRAKLSRLSGRTHWLVSAFAIARGGEVLHADHGAAALTMRSLSQREIVLYSEIAGEAVLSSVGGYQLEKLGAHLFERVEGDHTTVLGLPLIKLLAWLRERGMTRL